MATLVRLADDQQQPMRELKLALAVVEQALTDLAVPGKIRAGLVKISRASDYADALALAADAKHFLLRRLWMPENIWGQILQHHGARRLDRSRLVHTARNLEGPTYAPSGNHHESDE